MSLTDIITRLFRPLALGLCVASAGCGSEQGSVGRKQCFDPSVKGKIVFSNWRSEPFSRDIYTVNDDGSDLANLTEAEGGDFNVSPTWSPDGRFIAYSSNMKAPLEFGIYAMNVDGTNKRELTPFPQLFNNLYLKWSPDGRRIALIKYYIENSADPSQPLSELFVMSSGGDEPRTVANNLTSDFRAAWSPDGQKLAYDSGTYSSDSKIYVVNADGTDKKNLTFQPDPDYAPSWSPDWSPDGEKIAFERGTGEGYLFPIWIMNKDGTNKEQLFDPSSGFPVGGYPFWSPDGSKIAAHKPHYLTIVDFTINESQTFDLGGDPWPFVPDISWSSDGQKITYIESDEIYVINVDTGEITKIVEREEDMFLPIVEHVPCL